ncbi:MAG: hypothetical protein AB7T31_04090 [Gemmatimonadales bacterium]
MTLWGTVLVGLVGLVAALWARGRARSGAPAASIGARASRLLGALRTRLTSSSPLSAALVAAGLAGALSVAVTIGVYDRLLVGVDEMAQMIHARYVASGTLAAALPAGAEAWSIPNMLVTARGWTSQYPPGHPLVWSAFVVAGLPWAVGPALFAVMVGFLAASLDRLLPATHRLQARIAALAMALSPFALGIAATSSSHVTAGAAGAVALYAALRAVDGGRSWAALAGAAVGVMVLARPWTGLVLGPVLTLGVWLERGGRPLVARALIPWIAGGIPSALLLFTYDAAFFASPLRLGYEALYGPAHGLGLHSDPWSYPYGLREALAYSSSDLVQLGAALLESPVSVVLFGALYLAAVRALPKGVGVVAAWALLPVAANAAYWFHAPRMLFEAAPAWILLAVLGVTHAHARSGPVTRAAVGASAAFALVVAAPLAISRLVSERWSDETLSRVAVPEGADGALVFVHAPWDERMASMLQAAGMRNDSIQPILRRNDSCALYLYAAARLSGADTDRPDVPAIDPAQTHAPPARARPLVLEGGTRVWRDTTVAWTSACAREAASDRFGAVALAPLLWQGDLPGLEPGGPMFVRDLGPERNERVRAAFPDRRTLVFGYAGPGEPPSLMPYDAAMGLLWGQPPS